MAVEHTLPMSVETTASAGSALASSVSAARGLMRPVWDGVANPASSVAQAVFSAAISVSRVSSRAGAGPEPWSPASSASAASLASRRMPSAIGFTSPSVRASVSTWITWAEAGQYSSPYCGSVPNGPSRLPSASTTSAFASSRIAAFDP